MGRTPPPVSGTGGGGERSELSIHHTALSDQRNEISAPPEADVARNEPLSAEQRAHQSERLPQPERRSPKWNEAGAKRFAGPFVPLRRSRKQDAARLEQLRGHTAKTQRNLLDPDESIFEIFADVCRRRCSSGRRPQAPQRPQDFRKAHRRDNSTGAAGTSFGGGWRLWSEAEPACLEVAATHLNDLRFYDGRSCDF